MSVPQLVAGLRGVHQVIRDSVAIVLKTKFPEDAEVARQFIVFQRAVLALIQGHHHHEDDIVFPAMLNSGGKNCADWPQLLERLTKDHKDLEAILVAVSTYLDNPRGGSHVAVWTPVQKILLPHLLAEEDYTTPQRLETMPQEAQDAAELAIRTANKGDPLGYLTLPLLLWSMNEENYDQMVRPHFPAFVRKVLCNYIFYYKGASDLLPFVPHYRSTWEI
jgi:hypothetical protein